MGGGVGGGGVRDAREGVNGGRVRGRVGGGSERWRG